MTVRDALADGHLAEALRLQTLAVAADPTPAAELQLAELYLVAGKFREAFDTVSAIDSDDAAWPASRRSWRRLIRAVSTRSRGYRHLHPLSVDLPPHARHRLLVDHRMLSGDAEVASRHADKADETSPELFGYVDGQEFTGLRDLDDRFASVLEVFFGRRFVIVPLERLNRIRLLTVVGLADSVFRPAELRSTDGQVWPCVLPLTYPYSHGLGNFALGYETDCDENDSAVVTATGARVWYFGENEGPLSECRQIDLRVG